jgi:hypothetical protein
VIRHRAEALAGKYPPGHIPELANELEVMMVGAAVEYIAATGIKKPVSTKDKPSRLKKWYDELFD